DRDGFVVRDLLRRPLDCRLLGWPCYCAGAVPVTTKASPNKPASDRVETLTVKRDEAGMRLDRWFRVHFPEVTYTYLQKLLRTGQVRVDSRRAQANDRLEA